MGRGAADWEKLPLTTEVQERGAKAENWERRRLKMETQPLLTGRLLWHRSLARQSQALPMLGSPQALSCYTSQTEHQKACWSHPPPASTIA